MRRCPVLYYLLQQEVKEMRSLRNLNLLGLVLSALDFTLAITK